MKYLKRRIKARERQRTFRATHLYNVRGIRRSLVPLKAVASHRQQLSTGAGTAQPAACAFAARRVAVEELRDSFEVK